MSVNPLAFDHPWNKRISINLPALNHPWKICISINPPALDRLWKIWISINLPALDRPWKWRSCEAPSWHLLVQQLMSRETQLTRKAHYFLVSRDENRVSRYKKRFLRDGNCVLRGRNRVSWGVKLPLSGTVVATATMLVAFVVVLVAVLTVNLGITTNTTVGQTFNTKERGNQLMFLPPFWLNAGLSKSSSGIVNEAEFDFTTCLFKSWKDTQSYTSMTCCWR